MDQVKKLRWRIEDALKRSDLTAPQRLILLVLLTLVDVATGVVPAERSPSYTTLAKDTGLSRRSVVDGVKQLERSGWLIVRAPARADQLSKRARNEYVVQVPPATGAGGAPVQEVHQSAGATGAGGAPELVQELHATGAGAAHTPEPEEADHHQVEVWRVRDLVADEIAEFLADPAWTRERAAGALAAWASAPNAPDSVEAVARSKIKKAQAVELRARLEGAERATPPARSTPAPTCGQCDAPRWPDPDEPRRPAPGPAERQVFDADGRTSVPCPRCHPHPKRGRRAA